MKNTLATQLGMKVIAFGDHFLEMEMPVDERTIQPMGQLNGGASMALAETVGSLAANLSVEPQFACVGVEINGNHIKSVSSGKVVGTAKPIQLGRRFHVWSIEIKDTENKLICLSRLTMAVIDRNPK